MQRALSITSALAMVALSAVLAFKSSSRDASADAALAVTAARTAGDAGLDASPADAPHPPATPEATAMAFAAPDASALEAVAPELAKGAPRHVRFGVVFVEYAGAEGAAASARSKREALALATRLSADAKADFHGAVQHGDSGSSDDLGSVERGVLEPQLEAVLFSLPVGGVSDAVDTPRGFWIAKRLE